MSARPNRGRLFLVAIFALFSLPMIVAWVIYQGAGHAWMLPTRNYGVLIQPPRPVSLDGLSGIHGHPLGADLVQRHWTMMYLAPTSCDANCGQTLDAMRRVRLALGEDMKRLRRVYVMAADADEPPDVDTGVQIVRGSPKWLAQFAVADEGSVRRGRIFVVDPQGLQMMFYPPGADPKGILKDFKRLLKISLAG